MSHLAFEHGAAFHRVTTAVILANFAVAVAAHYDPEHEHAFAVTEAVCIVFFGVEMLIKMRAQGRDFWRSKWNVFDLTVIVLSALPMLLSGLDLSVLRVARVARLFHIGRNLSSLRLLRLGYVWTHSYAGFWFTGVSPWATVKYLVRR